MKNREIIRRAKKEIIIKLIVTFFTRAFLFMSTIIFGIVVDKLTNKEFDGAVRISLILLAIVIAYQILEVTRKYLWYKLYNKIYDVLTEEALVSTYWNSLFSLSRISTTTYLNIMNTDVDTISRFCTDLSMYSIRVIEFLVIAGYLFYLNSTIGIITIIVCLFSAFMLFKSGKPIEEKYQKRTKSNDIRSGAIHELIYCMKEVKTQNTFNIIKNNILKKNKVYDNDHLNQGMTSDLYRHITTLVVEITRVCLLIYGIYLISNGQMLLGSITVIYSYFGQLIDSIGQFFLINNELRILRVAQERYYTIFEYSQEFEDREMDINKDPQGVIEFKNILYGYRDNPTLDNVSFVIKANSINVVTGPRGGGKTGIFDLIMKYNRQHEGEILLDNIDINKYHMNEYFGLVSSVHKNPNFFQMSIRENLTMIEPDMDKVIKACKELGIYDDILNLSDGYDTVLMNEATNIPPNVKYLLAIVRMLLKNPKVMMFDETFLSFDHETKEQMLNLLNKLKENHTILIRSRDKEILSMADQILMIDDHKLVKKGTHKNLRLYKKYRNNII